MSAALLGLIFDPENRHFLEMLVDPSRACTSVYPRI
jgi:hypothetical protein